MLVNELGRNVCVDMEYKGGRLGRYYYRRKNSINLFIFFHVKDAMRAFLYVSMKIIVMYESS